MDAANVVLGHGMLKRPARVEDPKALAARKRR